MKTNMDHVAILRKSNIKKGDNLLEDILCGKKTVESRWYVNKIAPWNKIKAGDRVYFKESGCMVTARARVKDVKQYEQLTEDIINNIIDNYGDLIAPKTSKEKWDTWVSQNQHKRYCILIFLDSVEEIPSFDIDKSGYGISSAWLVTESIDLLQK